MPRQISATMSFHHSWTGKDKKCLYLREKYNFETGCHLETSPSAD